MRLEGKIGIITGAARGLGKAFAHKFAQEGARVVAVDLADTSETIKEVEALGSSGMAIRVDVSKEEDTLRMAEETLKRFGRIDILVNNAARFGNMGLAPIYEVDGAEWDKMMAVTVKGSWLCAKAVFPQMKRQGKGKIVNLSSSMAFEPSPGFGHYVVAKAAVIGLTRALAREMGEFGICVNAIAPGSTATEATKQWMSDEVLLQRAQRRVIKRVERPEDLVGIVAFLSSDESDFITGQTILVEGGKVMR